MSLGCLCLLAALAALALAQTTTTGLPPLGQSSSTSGGFATLGNIICASTGNRGIKAFKLVDAKLGEPCDGSLNFKRRSDAYDFAQTLQPDVYGSPELPHPAAARMLELLTGAGRRQRQSGALEFRACVKGTFCDSTTDVCVAAIETGDAGCSSDSECADYQDGYTGVDCESTGTGTGKCLVGDVYGAGESGCFPNADNALFEDTGCSNGDCVAGTCAIAGLNEACSSENDCAFDNYCPEPAAVCTARVSAGASCTSDDECAQGTICVGSPGSCTGVFSVGEGGACHEVGSDELESIVCKSHLVCSGATKTCIAPVNEGKSCTTQSDCGAGTVCAKSYLNCELKCLSNSIDSFVGKAVVNAIESLNNCMLQNECTIASPWKDNCVGKHCFSQAQKVAQYTQDSVVAMLNPAAALLVPVVAIFAAVAALL